MIAAVCVYGCCSCFLCFCYSISFILTTTTITGAAIILCCLRKSIGSSGCVIHSTHTRRSDWRCYFGCSGASNLSRYLCFALGCCEYSWRWSSCDISDTCTRYQSSLLCCVIAGALCLLESSNSRIGVGISACGIGIAGITGRAML